MLAVALYAPLRAIVTATDVDNASVRVAVYFVAGARDRRVSLHRGAYHSMDAISRTFTDGALMDPVVHFEMPCDDSERVARFYQTAPDWDV